MFGLGPAYLFLLQHRVPIGFIRAGRAPWISAMATNTAIASPSSDDVAGGSYAVPARTPADHAAGVIHRCLVILCPTPVRGDVLGRTPRLDLHEAALHGSSHYDLPHVLRWFTANIGVHHVHHLCSRIPYYRLPGVLRDHPELGEVGRLTLMQSLGCVRLVLWDESRRRLISFGELRTVDARAQ